MPGPCALKTYSLVPLEWITIELVSTRSINYSRLYYQL